MYNTSAEIAASLAHLKFWTASLHDQASKGIIAYSQRLSKPLGEWAGQDANSASSLLQVSFGLAQKDKASSRFSWIATKPATLIVPPIRAGKPDDKDGAIEILNIIGNSEKYYGNEIAEIAKLHLAKDIFQILNLHALAQTSKDRVQVVLEMKERIETGDLWRSPFLPGRQEREPIIWRCLKCGAQTKSVNAFEECSCCEAPRSFATSATF